jgi:tetratricopeptide (TPR) repeat protein
VRRLIGIGILPGLLLCFALTSVAAQSAAERIAAGTKLLDEGNIDAAISEFQRAAEMDRKHGAALLNLGQAYERANRNDEAVDAYRKSIELEPRNFYAHNNLGVLYDRQGKYDEAIAEFQSALSDQPNNAMALKNLETAKKNKILMQERTNLISRAMKEVESKPQDPTPAYHLARLHASYGNQQAAIEWLGKAIQRGYRDFAYIKTDPAFVSMRDEREFELLLLRK